MNTNTHSAEYHSAEYHSKEYKSTEYKRALALYENNLGLLGCVLRGFPFLAGEDREDGLAAARLGLWQAAQSFDPARGVRFSSYGTEQARYALLKHLKTQRRQGRLPCTSLDAPLERKDGSGGALADLVADPQAEVPGAALVSDAGFARLLFGLPERQQALLFALYAGEPGSGEPPFEEGQAEQGGAARLAEAWGISRQRVHQIEQAALAAVRKKMMGEKVMKRKRAGREASPAPA